MEFVKDNLEFEKVEDILEYLKVQNKKYLKHKRNTASISLDKRILTESFGQHPFATIITCSDSRVPAEHIFNAGIGELFVIRTAGNVIGEYELGSIEYAVDHLHTKLVLVLGHTNCGAVDAALNSKTHGYVTKIVEEILRSIPKGTSVRDAEILNVKNSIARIEESDIVKDLENNNQIKVLGAIYNIRSGKVEFLD